MSNGTACITGATSGIGREYARALAKRGLGVILTGRRELELRRLADELHHSAQVPVEVVIGDLSDPAVSATLAQRLAARKDLTMLVHNAGYGHRETFFHSTPGELREMGEVHGQCAVQLVRAVVPAMREARHRMNGAAPPAVILVSSLAAFMPAPGPAMYTATKAFLVFLGGALQPELAESGIRLQVLCPGFTHTEFHDRLEWDGERRRNRGLVRWMRADDVVRRSMRRLDRRSLWTDPAYVPGLSNRVLLLIVRCIPRRVYLFFVRRFRF